MERGVANETQSLLDPAGELGQQDRWHLSCWGVKQQDRWHLSCWGVGTIGQVAPVLLGSQDNRAGGTCPAGELEQQNRWHLSCWGAGIGD